MKAIASSAVAYAVLAMASAWAQTPPIGGIYTCVDAKGRKLTSDRPIAECADREQRVLNSNGTVKARVGPTLTDAERVELEKSQTKALEEQNRLGEEKRRNRALLNRYPNKQVHDQERSEALAQVAVVVKAASNRIEELARQRTAIDAELEFYKGDVSKAPAYLRRQVEENTQSQAVQRRFIAEQDAEARRVNARFDDELVRLRQLWPIAAK